MAGLAEEECLGQERAMHCQLRFCFANIIVFPKHSMLHLDCCFVKWIFFSKFPYLCMTLCQDRDIQLPTAVITKIGSHNKKS